MKQAIIKNFLHAGKLLAIAIGVLLFFKPLFAAPLINPVGLINSFEQVKNGAIILLDIRIDPKVIKDKKAREGYIKLSKIKKLEFIPNSVHIPYSSWRAKDIKNPGKLISIQKIENNIQKLGFNTGEKVVIIYQGYDQTDFGAAARVYWTLKSAGIKDVSILNGGFIAFAKEYKNQFASIASNPPRSSFKVSFNKTWLVQLENIKKASGRINNEDILLDARVPEQFNGVTKHPAARTYGTIPNAQPLNNFVWFGKNGQKLQNISNLKNIAKTNNLLQSNQEIYSFCNTGHWAATNWFVLSELLNVDGVKLYPGSFVEYAQDKNNTVANEPNRFIRLIRSLTN